MFGQYTGLDGTTHTLDVSEARFAAVTEELAVTRENPADLSPHEAIMPQCLQFWDEPSTAAKHSTIRKSVGYRKQRWKHGKNRVFLSNFDSCATPSLVSMTLL